MREAMPEAPSMEREDPEPLPMLRAHLLAALEACERGLAAAYRQQAAKRRGITLADRQALEETARHHLRHAAAIRDRRPGGRGGGSGRSGDDVDPLWVVGAATDPTTLALAEKRAYETLHDCLSDLDPP